MNRIFDTISCFTMLSEQSRLSKSPLGSVMRLYVLKTETVSRFHLGVTKKYYQDYSIVYPLKPLFMYSYISEKVRSSMIIQGILNFRPSFS